MYTYNKVVNTGSHLTSYASEIPLSLCNKHNNIEMFTIQKTLQKVLQFQCTMVLLLSLLAVEVVVVAVVVVPTVPSSNYP